MKPIIDELIEKATRRYDRLGFELENGPEFDRKLFAELILIESIAAIERKSLIDVELGTPEKFDRGLLTGYMNSMHAIQSHFGIS